mmetsp:Transcript_39117/g.74957  ORF Transcript_39117/g.74957 Transcript_39117/m.74957 type:complete len:255 (+) Transcript_39117:188-952(+)
MTPILDKEVHLGIIHCTRWSSILSSHGSSNGAARLSSGLYGCWRVGTLRFGRTEDVAGTGVTSTSDGDVRVPKGLLLNDDEALRKVCKSSFIFSGLSGSSFTSISPAIMLPTPRSMCMSPPEAEVVHSVLSMIQSRLSYSDAMTGRRLGISFAEGRSDLLMSNGLATNTERLFLLCGPPPSQCLPSAEVIRRIPSHGVFRSAPSSGARRLGRPALAAWLGNRSKLMLSGSSLAGACGKCLGISADLNIPMPAPP